MHKPTFSAKPVRYFQANFCYDTHVCGSVLLLCFFPGTRSPLGIPYALQSSLRQSPTIAKDVVPEDVKDTKISSVVLYVPFVELRKIRRAWRQDLIKALLALLSGSSSSALLARHGAAELTTEPSLPITEPLMPSSDQRRRFSGGIMFHLRKDQTDIRGSPTLIRAPIIYGKNTNNKQHSLGQPKRWLEAVRTYPNREMRASRTLSFSLG